LKTVAIVCEYNPFHFGHLYQIETVRKIFGKDTAIIAVMSGNFTQRGDLAVLGKFERARIAVECGVSLVLELPFPYSAGSAEYFADAAVEIITKLGCVDILSFGSESGDLVSLKTAAKRLSSDEYASALKEAAKSDAFSACGHAALATKVYQKLYGSELGAAFFSSPNNILAIEYLKALERKDAKVLPHTILRRGTDLDHADGDIPYAGATYIRSLLLDGKENEAFLHMPQATVDIFKNAMASGCAPVSFSALSGSILAHLRLCDTGAVAAECGGGLLEHLRTSAKTAGTLDALLSDAATKKFTQARLRRALLFSYFGVTPDMLRQTVGYTQVLAMDSLGQAVLHDIRKTSHIPILTKPADIQKLPPEAQKQAMFAHRADSVYALASPVPQSADIFLCTSPYRK